MKITDIDFPRPLLTALRNGRLVVFAGAGVSMGEPADLPDFENLARAIAKGTGSTLEQRGMEDVFLGRLHDRGIAVHELAARELSKNNPQPTDLHKDLLRLHLAKQSVRLVTTNFDLLFERAAEDVLDQKPRSVPSSCSSSWHQLHWNRPTSMGPSMAPKRWCLQTRTSDAHT